MQPSARTRKGTGLNVHIDAKLRNRLKIEAAKRDTTMGALVEEALIALLTPNRAKRAQ